MIKIAIASGKGGTGKTLLSTNLASLIGKKQKIVLVDLDVEEPNDLLFVDGLETRKIEQFKMIPTWDKSTCTLCGECSTNCKFHAVVKLGEYIAVFDNLCHSCYACSELCPTQSLPMKKHKMGEITEFENSDFKFVESRLIVGEEMAVPLINNTHKWVDKYYSDVDVQLFDSPPGTSCPVIATTEKVDFVILVTEPTPFGLNDLILAVETMQKLKKPIGVVINRYGVGNDEVEHYCVKNNIPIMAKIPYSREIAHYYSKGELAYMHVPMLKDSLNEINNFLLEYKTKL